MSSDPRQKILNEGIQDVLKNAQIMRVAMVDGKRPYVVPVNFGYGDGRLYFHSKMNGKKMDILARNPEVCFEMDYGFELITNELACKWSSRFKSVVGFGTASILSDAKDKIAGYDAIMRKYGGDKKFEYDEKQVAHSSVVCITISEMSYKLKGKWDE